MTGRADTSTPMSRALRFALLAGVTAASALLSAALTVTVLQGAPVPSAALLKAELGARCAAEDQQRCGQDTINALLTDTAATGPMLAAVENLLAGDPSLLGGCHSATHLVGAAIGRLVGEGQQIPVMGERWYLCAEGLAHGFLEHVELGGKLEQAVPNALAACAAVGATETDLNLCPHGIGHSLYSSLGKRPVAALEGCAAAFGSEIAQQVCARGVYMSYADEYIHSGKLPVSLRSAGAWAAAMPRCDSDDRFEFLCPSMFAAVAAAQSVDTIEAFLQWCDLVPDAKSECLDALGLIIGGELAMSANLTGQVPKVCALYAGTVGGELRCWEQLYLGATSSGRSVDAVALTCAAVGARSEECGTALAAFARDRAPGGVDARSAGR